MNEEMQQRNWDFLLHRLKSSPIHAEVERQFTSATPETLARLLRDHATEGVSNPDEIRFRKTMDQWLGQVSMLYEAWLCGYIPDPAQAAGAETLRLFLSREELRAYYEKHYPVALPWLFRLHLEGKLKLPPESNPSGAGAFERFSILYERFRGDEDLDQFLDFLDGFVYGGAESRIDVRTVVNSFATPGRVAEALGRPVGQVTRLDRGIVGMVRFLTFGNDLDHLLQMCREMPLVQSAFWFFYSYWFNEYQVDVLKASEEAIGKIVEAVPGSAETGVREELLGAMKRLTGGGYAKVLLEEVGKQEIEVDREIPLLKPIVLKGARVKGGPPGSAGKAATFLKTSAIVPLASVKESDTPAGGKGEDNPVHWLSRFDRYAAARPAARRPAAKKKRRVRKVRK